MNDSDINPFSYKFSLGINNGPLIVYGDYR